MSDASFNELLSAWLDGQLTGSEKARAERLISENPECADLVRQWKLQREQIRDLPRYRLDSEFSERVLAKARLTDDAGRVSSVLPTAATRSVAQEPPSYFASRSALTAITALAAMLLLTLFTLPNRGLQKKVVVGPGIADKAHDSSDNFGGAEIVSTKDEKTDDSRSDRMKAGEADLEFADSRNDLETSGAVAVESLAESDEGIQFKPSFGGVARGSIGGDVKREAMKMTDGLAKESRPAANSKAFDINSVDSQRKQVTGLEPTLRQAADLPGLQDEIPAQQESDLGARFAKGAPPAVPASGMPTNKAPPRGASLQSLSLTEEQQEFAKDRVSRNVCRFAIGNEFCRRGLDDRNCRSAIAEKA